MGQNAAGVILTLTAEFAGWWIDITKDSDGRIIFASIFFCDDTTARINATYGVSGACCPNFTSFTGKSMAEAQLKNYITEQSTICDDNGYHMVVAGDINSYTQPFIDHLGGPTNVRTNCLAATLIALGFKDEFRGRHANKIAFTYISKLGGSRLHQIWTRPATGTCLEVLKATITWKWPYPTVPHRY